jgi:hypothetical protein
MARGGAPDIIVAIPCRGAGRYSYFILIATVAAICISLYRYLKKVRWL